MENLFTGNYRRWLLLENPSPDSALMARTGLPEPLMRLLAQRGYQEARQISTFLNPDLTYLHDPFLMNGMTQAVDRLLAAMEAREKVLVYGDYDVDGVTATAILVHFFRGLGLDVSFYIPDRVDEGYGISDAGVDFICKSQFDLVVTVDCGITARFQVEAICEKSSSSRSKMTDVIITDHHQYHEGMMPEALAVINPHAPHCRYPFKNLCGAGIALKMVQALGIKAGQPDVFKSYLDLAALATIADVVDLQDENRIIVKYGLEKMNRDGCTGIRALLMAAGQIKEPVDAFKASYLLAPRVNAAGRMGDAKRAVSLFTTTDENEAQRIATELNQTNTMRQEVQDQIYRQAIDKIDQDPRYATEKVIVVWGESWHHGVIGIVASKLVDRYHKPAFVLSSEGDRVVGSGRSIEGFNLFHCLEAMSSLLIKFGGHEQAGGLTLMTEDLGYFRTRVNAYAQDRISEDMILSSITISAQLEYTDINLQTAKSLARLEPFGQGNPIPVFLLKGASLLEKKQMGNGRHLRLKLGLGNQSVDAVFFSKGDFAPLLQAGDRLDIAFSLEINAWQGREFLQLRLLDMRLEETVLKRNRFLMEAAKRFELLDCDHEWLYNGILDKTINSDDVKVAREDLIVIYKYIMKQELKNVRIADLFSHARILSKESGRNINFYKLILALFIFDELDLVSFTLVRDGSYELTRSEEIRKVNLEESELFSYVRDITEACG